TGNRRIGPSLAFVLTREKLEALLAAPPSGGLMPGQFKVQFTEPNPALSGDYILHFRVERVP
ncbi:MAG: hypothetical protein H7Z74_12675, partial [Anaerolineae bacterium]|nr:hypothetical protein [Gemmatimonadaceae bacterium]